MDSAALDNPAEMPAATPPAAPASSGPVDFSGAGGSTLAAPSNDGPVDFSRAGGSTLAIPTAKPPANADNPDDWAAFTGMGKSLVSGVNGIAGGLDWAAGKLNTLEGKPNVVNLKDEAQKLEQKYVPSLTSDPQGWQEKTGAALEQASESLYGEGEVRAAMKGLSLAGKMKMLAPVVKFLEEHPKSLARLAHVGAAAADTGAVQGVTGGVQALAHGATPEDAAETALETGGAGAVLHGAMGTVGVLRARHAAALAAVQEHAVASKAATEGYEQALAAREAALSQAHVEWGNAVEQQKAEHQTAMENYQGNVADRQAAMDAQNADYAKNKTDFDQQTQLHRQAVKEIRTKAIAQMIDQRQATAQQGIKNVAKDATARIVDRMNDAREVPLAMTGEPLAEQTFEPIDKQAAIDSTDTFGDAADHARAGAVEIYDKFNEATNGQFDKLKNARSQAYRSGDFKAYQEATDAIDQLLASKPDALKPAEFAAAKANWVDERDLDRLHNAVEGSFNGISEEEAAKEGTSERMLKGGASSGALQTRIGSILTGKNAIPVERLNELIGPEGVTGLYRASHLTSTPELSKATKTLAEEVAKALPAPKKAPKPGKLWNPLTPKAPEAIPRPTGRDFPEPEKPLIPEAPKMAKGSVAGVVGNAITTTMIGGAAGHFTGVSPYYMTPAIAGTRYVLRQMVVNPQVGQMMEYAVTHGVTPKRAAGLIAATIAGTAGANREGASDGK